MAVLVGLLAVLYVGFAALTWLGSRRRQSSFGAAVLSGVLFPAAWASWYVHDELRPERHRG
jgi:hypothetical protein